MLLAVTAVADPFKKIKASEAQGDKVKFPSGDWRDWAQKLHDYLLAKRTQARRPSAGATWTRANPGIPPGGERGPLEHAARGRSRCSPPSAAASRPTARSGTR